jgi:hypothetical protein
MTEPTVNEDQNPLTKPKFIISAVVVAIIVALGIILALLPRGGGTPAAEPSNSGSATASGATQRGSGRQRVRPALRRPGQASHHAHRHQMGAGRKGRRANITYPVRPRQDRSQRPPLLLRTLTNRGAVRSGKHDRCPQLGRRDSFMSSWQYRARNEMHVLNHPLQPPPTSCDSAIGRVHRSAPMRPIEP